MARLEMALSQLEFALERSEDWEDANHVCFSASSQEDHQESLRRGHRVAEQPQATCKPLLLCSTLNFDELDTRTQSWCCNAAFSDYSVLFFIYI